MVNSTALSDSSKKIRQENLAAVIASAAAIFICLFGNLGAIGLMGPDEPRYAWIARAMAESGDWITPRLYGQPWFEKPVLYYWAAAAGFRLNLSPEWAARLPSACAALAGTIAVSWLAWVFFDARQDFVRGPALIAPLLFSTSVAAIGFSRAATPDMLFSASIALGMACAAAILRRAGFLSGAKSADASASKSDLLLLILWGAFLGAGVLAKGPAAIILAGGAIALWALGTRHWRPGFRLAHPLAIGAFCVVALPWYILCSIRNPQFLRVFILQHNFERYLTPIFMHRQPAWFFVPIFFLALLPWSALLWPASREALEMWVHKSWRNSPGFFFACWTVFPVLFFSLSQSKLPSYILPAVPPAALLLSVVWTRLRGGDPASGRAFPRVATALGITWMLLGAGTLVWLHRLPAGMQDELRGPLHALAILGVAGGGWVIFQGLRAPRLVFFTSVFLAVACVVFVNQSLLPALDPYLSARTHAAFLRHNLYPSHIFTYELPRSWNFGLAFYFHRELPEWSPQDSDAVLLLTTPQGFERIKEQGRFGGTLEETYRGILFVPVLPEARSASR